MPSPHPAIPLLQDKERGKCGRQSCAMKPASVERGGPERLNESPMLAQLAEKRGLQSCAPERRRLAAGRAASQHGAGVLLEELRPAGCAAKADFASPLRQVASSQEDRQVPSPEQAVLQSSLASELGSPAGGLRKPRPGALARLWLGGDSSMSWVHVLDGGQVPSVVLGVRDL